MLLGHQVPIYGGQHLQVVDFRSCLQLRNAERVFPRIWSVSHGAHLNEGNAININITAIMTKFILQKFTKQEQLYSVIEN